jgi:predicted ArsR family transcriptional regulator
MPLNQSSIHRTLASPSRLEILKLLYRKPRSVEEIAENLGLQTITIRHHLQALVEAGIIEYHEERTGAAGRPRAYYSIVKAPPMVTFPKRQYQFLSEILINGMIDKMGVNKTKEFLRDIGISTGKEAVKQIESEHHIENWSPKEYERYIVKEYLESEGAEPEVLETSSKRVIYRLHNCLFRELSVKMPDIMCDVLHESFHEGVSKAIGKDLKVTRSTCMGHGDPYCEQVCVWATKKK